MTRYSRRLFLQLSGIATAGTLVPAAPAAPAAPSTPPASLVPPASPAPPGDAPFALLRRNWRDVTTGSRFDPAAEPYRTRLAKLGTTAAGHRDTMAPTDLWLWPDLAFPSYAETPARLLTMAHAYALPGTGLTGDADLGATVAAGIDHYRRQVYAADASPVGNWWNWQIGVPKKLLDAAVLIDTHLTEPQSAALREAVDHFVPEHVLSDYSGTSTGANRVDLCTVMLLRAILGADTGKAALAASALSPTFPYVTDGDGFHRDGSFIQHTFVPYQGGYGAVLLSGLAALFAVLHGSPWEITDPNRQIVFDTVEKSFAPFVHDGFCMDMVSGRGISRKPFGDHEKGCGISFAILLLGDTASPAERARWQAMVKGWAQRDTVKSMLKEAESSDLEFHARLTAVLGDGAIPAAAEPAGHRLLPMSARAVHRRPGWCAGLSMASYRIGHYEHGNGDNPRGWHTGSGMLYWWGQGHGGQYSDSFWATVDPYRLPGTTVSTQQLADGAGRAWGDNCPPARWVGGATDGVYATVGQHLNGFESTMEAFKSWFFLDDAVVCLGAGITGGDGVPVETIVDNRRTGAVLTVDRAGGWAHLAGHAGYVLFCSTPLSTLREKRVGDTSTVTRNYVTLWFDHGVDPVSEDYVYLLLPNASLAETQARAADAGWLSLLANDDLQQGVHVPSLGITAVNFWKDGTTGDLTASAPCAVLVRERGDGTATLTVSDPRCDLSALTVTWNRPVAEVLHGDPLLTDSTTGANLTLTFGRLSDQAGDSKTVTVRLG